MDRRQFLQSAGAASALGMSASGASSAADREGGPPTLAARRPARSTSRRAWLFWDLWHLDRAENLALCQGRARWRPEGTYVDDVDGLAAWPTVYRDEATKRWRMLYTSRWKPYTLFVLESEDGFAYLESRGSWARFVSKPLVLLAGDLTMNVAAPWGEVRYQLCDLKNSPLTGFTFDDCQAAVREDALDRPLRWRDRNAAELLGRVVRLDVAFRAARLHALRGGFHFIDAQDLHLLNDGQKIDTALFDF